MEVKVLNTAGSEVGTVELSDAVFGCEYNEALIHQVVVAYLANQRQGTKSTLTRTEVRGGGIKPWQHPRTAMDQGRRRVCTQAARLQQEGKQEDEGAGFPQRTQHQTCRQRTYRA